jgi:hypothetical protein
VFLITCTQILQWDKMRVGEKKFMKKQLKKPQLKIYFEDMLLLDRIANIADALSVCGGGAVG